MEEDLATSWLLGETLVVGEVILVMVEILVEEEAVVAKMVAAEGVVEVMMVDRIDWGDDGNSGSGPGYSSRGGVDQDVGTTGVDMVVVEEEDMEVIREEVTMVVLGTLIVLEIIMDNSNQVMGS